MLLANTGGRPTHPRRVTTARPPRLWRDLPVDDRRHLAHLVARLVRQIRTSLEKTPVSGSSEITYISKEEVEVLR